MGVVPLFPTRYVMLNLLPALTVVGVTLTLSTVGITFPSSLITLNSAVEDAMGFDGRAIIINVPVDLGVPSVVVVRFLAFTSALLARLPM